MTEYRDISAKGDLSADISSVDRGLGIKTIDSLQRISGAWDEIKVTSDIFSNNDLFCKRR